MLSLQTRARLAVPLYWLAGKFLTWANWVDGPQPRKAKTPREMAERICAAPGATKEDVLASFGSVQLRKRAREVLDKHEALLRRMKG